MINRYSVITAIDREGKVFVSLLHNCIGTIIRGLEWFTYSITTYKDMGRCR